MMALIAFSVFPATTASSITVVQQLNILKLLSRWTQLQWIKQDEERDDEEVQLLI